MYRGGIVFIERKLYQMGEEAVLLPASDPTRLHPSQLNKRMHVCDNMHPQMTWCSARHVLVCASVRRASTVVWVARVGVHHNAPRQLWRPVAQRDEPAPPEHADAIALQSDRETQAMPTAAQRWLILPMGLDR